MLQKYYNQFKSIKMYFKHLWYAYLLVIYWASASEEEDNWASGNLYLLYIFVFSWWVLISCKDDESWEITDRPKQVSM